MPALASANGIAIQITGDTHIHISNAKELDEDALALKIGRQFAQNIKKALENRA
ncbi:hypothetical protein L7E55_07860 [Pelotomaculum isophthalicicum JI]|uniref:Uncharacterized protein n=1 Tax=Pelotomaculum isophthalicicum JI TaxID=947010 RepID=A0A9X4JT74_9FIRM|nr:hypothetical protein [Pelotomaculum isophthalicicum]MDF9408274.1 hypothetical protein [Pelotomaculum isophthalicicum JI]